MTISNTQDSITVQGDALTSTWNYDFYIGGSANYATLIFTDSAGTTSSIAASAFSITNVTDPEGGTFTYPLVGSPITAGESLTLYRIVPLTQNVAIGNQGNFYPSVVEGEFDYLTMVDQQQQTQIDQALSDASTAQTLAEGALQAANNLDDVDDVATSRTNLGLTEVSTASIGTGLTLVSGVLSAPGAGGTVQTISTGTGLFGGPITTTGTIAITTSGVTTSLLADAAVTYPKFQNVAASRLFGNPTTASVTGSEISLGAGLAFSGTSIIVTTGTGTLTQINTGAGLTGGPITASGTISLSPITTGFVLANFSGGALAPQGVQLVAGSGITFSGTTTSLTITASGGGTPATVLLSEVVTAASQVSVTFSSITSSYRDLEIRVRGRGTGAGGNADRAISLQFNGDAGSNYNYELGFIQNGAAGQAGSTGTTSVVVALIPAAGSTANYAGAANITIPDYRGTTFFKQVIGHGGEAKTSALANHNAQVFHGNWLSTSAITSISVIWFDGGGFVDNSVVSLYGHL